MLPMAKDSVQKQQQFSQLYERHVGQVYRYLFARLGQVQEAQDITAQSFLVAWEHFGSLQQEEKAAGWLIGIARHKLADYFRAAPTKAAKTMQSLEDVVAIPDNTAQLFDVATLHLRLEQVQHALQQLTAERAEAITLRFFAGLSAKEAAAVMGKNEASVKMLVMRGLDDLRRRLGDE